MSLSIAGNSALLVTQRDLGGTQSAFGASLQRLSSGLKINPSADGSADPGISQPALDTAITNSNTAIDAAQTADGALGEINRLLDTIKGFALNSASAGANDAAARSNDQRQVTNALTAINSVVNNTEFGNVSLFTGTDAGTAPATVSTGTEGATFSPADFATAVRAYAKQATAAVGNLSQIDVSSATGANDAIAAIDTARGDVAQSRGQISAFETETLQAIQSGLQPQQTIKPAVNADLARETANFTAQNRLLPGDQNNAQAVLSVLHAGP
jgi:flagellin